MKHPARWSKAESRLLLALKAEGKTDREIGAYFGVSEKAAAMKYSRTRERVDREKWEEGPFPLRQIANEADKPSLLASEVARRAQVVRAALPAPVSLTAAICGDPLPGRSALDQKRGITT
jgi:hypothetical protein